MRRARVLAGKRLASSLPARTRARRWLHYLFKEHQPTERLENVPASRQRRLNHTQHPALERDSIVADATGKKFTPNVG